MDLSPCQTVAALNQAVTRLTSEDKLNFATGIYLRFERDLERVTCCSFGHEGPIFFALGTDPGGRGVGVYPVRLMVSDEGWRETRIELGEHGTGFLVFSDGITEQFDAEGRMFGIERLHDSFRRHLDAPVKERVRRIVEDLARFRVSALVKDDQTLLALEFVGTA